VLATVATITHVRAKAGALEPLSGGEPARRRIGIMPIFGTAERARRRRRGLVVAVAVGLVSVGLSHRGVAAHDDDQDQGRACSNATLQGDYGFLVSGFKPIPPPTGGLERFNAVGIYDFDGEGSFTFEGGALQGEITGLAPPPSNVVGTYAVNENCTGTMSWQPDPPLPVFIRFSIVVVKKGRQVELAGTTGLSQGEAIRQ